jgi:hypothetical protein
VAEGASEPTLTEATCPCDNEIATFRDPVTGDEFEKESAVEAAGTVIVDIFDAGGMA